MQNKKYNSSNKIFWVSFDQLTYWIFQRYSKGNGQCNGGTNKKQTNNYAKHEKQRFARQVAKHFAVVNVRLSDWL